MGKRISRKQKDKIDRKVVQEFNINKLKRCPFCSSTNIEIHGDSGLCNNCRGMWEE